MPNEKTPPKMKEPAKKREHHQEIPRAGDYAQADESSGAEKKSCGAIELLVDGRKVASTLGQLLILQAIKKVLSQNFDTLFEGIVTRQDIERVVRVPSATLTEYLDKLEEHGLITPYRNRTWIFAASENQQRLLDYVVKQWRQAIQPQS